MATDYRSTVFLPQTDFPMRADLPKREPLLLERWAKTDLWRRQRALSTGREKFVLHDGPPYANGNLHIGHALNKILKDLINRAQQMLGKDAHYVPGWDCHGLPIEWKIEENYRAKKKSKDEVPIVQFRKECRDFAAHWIDVQREEFKRLGVIGDWDHPYTTMSFDAEAQIARELGKFLMNGSLYRGTKPVMWSVVEQTALAEAEIEYHDHTSTTVWVKFPIVKASRPELAGASVVIWTTTPWTLPGNRAIAYGKDVEYVLIEATRTPDQRPLPITEHDLSPSEIEAAQISHISPERYAAQKTQIIKDEQARIFFSGVGRFVVAKDLQNEFLHAIGAQTRRVISEISGSNLAGTVSSHPLRGQGYDFPVPLLSGDFVTVEQGTGFVHIAPGHGTDDYELGLKHGIEMPQTVGADGTYYPHVPLFAGKHVYWPNGKTGDANKAVIDAIRAAGGLIAEGKLVHSYPHSWRSKAPLIFRNTPQWFISMEKNQLRQKALAAIAATRWIPPQGENRLRSMIETRPDWNVSRQRAWGVPITVFVDKKSGEPLRDQGVIDRIAAAFEREGADAWYTTDPKLFLGNRDPNDYEQVTDILDVWFDSGSTHAFVLEKRPDLKWPASLYLEGSDQHRGWFHSSLLEACGTRGRAPYEAVLTHGFTLDEQGRKMSKSLGNVTSPQDVVAQSGADILRLWVVSTDYTEDQRIGPEILKYQAEAYRRLRNTLRYLLGGLAGFSESERLAPDAMPELERWVLHRLAELDQLVRRSAEACDFHTMFTALHNFCAVDLSAFYFDVRKDALYCDPAGAPRRRAARTVLDLTFDRLTRWLAPVLCFTAEEAWLARHGDAPETSVHFQTYADVPAAWRNDALGARWARVRDLRRVVTGALELERAQKRIGSSLQAAVTVYADQAYIDALNGLDLAEICITSTGTLTSAASPAGAFTLPDVAGVAVIAALAPGDKCQRCWRVLTEVGSVAAHPDLCERCSAAVDALASQPLPARRA